MNNAAAPPARPGPLQEVFGSFRNEIIVSAAAGLFAAIVIPMVDGKSLYPLKNHPIDEVHVVFTITMVLLPHAVIWALLGSRSPLLPKSLFMFAQLFLVIMADMALGRHWIVCQTSFAPIYMADSKHTKGGRRRWFNFVIRSWLFASGIQALLGLPWLFTEPSMIAVACLLLSAAHNAYHQTFHEATSTYATVIVPQEAARARAHHRHRVATYASRMGKGT